MIARRSLIGVLAASALAPQARAANPITLAVSSNSLAYGGLNIARKAGLFERHGIDPTISVMDSGSAAMTAVLSGSIQFCSASLGEVLAARVHGQGVVVVANIYRGLSGSLVLSKATADKLVLTPSAPLDAKLKAIADIAIATPSATSSYTFPFRIAGQAAGALPHFVYMAQPAMLAALKAGAIQGMIAGAPFSTLAVSSGAGIMWVNGPREELPDDVRPTSSACVETSQAYAAANPEIVTRLRAAFDDLAQFIHQQPDAALKMLASAYPQLDAETIAAIFQSDAPNWARPTMTIEDIRHEISLQERAGLLKGVNAIDPATVLAS